MQEVACTQGGAGRSVDPSQTMSNPTHYGFLSMIPHVVNDKAIGKQNKQLGEYLELYDSCRRADAGLRACRLQLIVAVCFLKPLFTCF